MATVRTAGDRGGVIRRLRPGPSTFVMALVLITLGFYLIYPVLLLLVNSFNTAPEVFVGPRQWGLDNWRDGLNEPRLLGSLWNSIMIWALVVGISFPVAVLISWTLARTKIPFSHGLEFMFWVSFMMPSIATTIGWIMLADPDIGFVNTLVAKLPFFDRGPFNIFSVPGIVWAHVMANGISIKVMLLTPAFRNMDATMEEAARVGGASNLRTMARVTLPLMISPMVLVFALQMIRIFQSFETEFLLGIPFGFFVYSTLIFEMVRSAEPPLYGQATVLASVTLLVITFIIPLQRWILSRRRYTTISGQFRPGLIDFGRWNIVLFAAIAALIVLLTLAPAFVLVWGSFMTRAGFFQITPTWTLDHWRLVLGDELFLRSLRTTLALAITAALASPLMFSLLAYILVRTTWRGRWALDLIIWGSAAVPGILAGLGLLMLFLGTPVLTFLYGTIWALLLVVVIQGNTTGTNITKGVYVQVGADMEEQARVSGAGWIGTYFRIWLPLLMPTMVLLATMNFVLAAGTTSSIILLASRETMTLSLLALEFNSPGVGLREEAGIVSLFIMALTVGIALVMRAFGLRMGVQHGTRLRKGAEGGAPSAATAAVGVRT